MTNFSIIEHLKNYYEGEDTRNFTVLDFVGAFGSPLLALAYSKLFWPDFVEFNEMVFLTDSVDGTALRPDTAERIKSYRATGRSKEETEKSFNLFEIPSSFFNRGSDDTSDEADEQLAQLLTITWSCKLKRDFPERIFFTETVSPSDTGGEFALRFFQVNKD